MGRGRVIKKESGEVGGRGGGSKKGIRGGREDRGGRDQGSHEGEGVYREYKGMTWEYQTLTYCIYTINITFNLSINNSISSHHDLFNPFHLFIHSSVLYP